MTKPNQQRELICCRWYHYRGERFLFFFHAHQVEQAQMSALGLWERGLLSYDEAEEICDSLARCAQAGAA
jgi:hypothetical protein